MRKWKLSALAALLTTTSLLTGCATGLFPRKESPSLNLHQPPVLRLSPGQPIQTVDGIYIPPIAETWHSDTRFRHLEAQVEALAIANAQHRDAPRQ